MQHPCGIAGRVTDRLRSIPAGRSRCPNTPVGGVRATPAVEAGRIVVVGRHTGWLGAARRGGQRMLILPDGAAEMVAGDITDAEIVDRFGVDEVVRMPRFEFNPCSGWCLVGPYVGRKLD
jgi:hypothetical protein